MTSRNEKKHESKQIDRTTDSATIPPDLSNELVKEVSDFIRFMQQPNIDSILQQQFVEAIEKAKMDQKNLNPEQKLSLVHSEAKQHRQHNSTLDLKEALDANIRHAAHMQVIHQESRSIPLIVEQLNLKNFSDLFLTCFHYFFLTCNNNIESLRNLMIDSGLLKFINIQRPVMAGYDFRNTTLHTFISNEENQHTISLLQVGMDAIDPNIRDSQGKSAFLLAAKMGNGVVIDLFLELAQRFNPQLDINLQDDQGRTALHYVCAIGRLDIAEKLIANGANADIRDNFEQRPIDMTFASQKEILDIFASVGIDANRDRDARHNSDHEVSGRGSLLDFSLQGQLPTREMMFRIENKKIVSSSKESPSTYREVTNALSTSDQSLNMKSSIPTNKQNSVDEIPPPTPDAQAHRQNTEQQDNSVIKVNDSSINTSVSTTKGNTRI